MSTETTSTSTDEQLPRWSVEDVHESLVARSFVDAMELMLEAQAVADGDGLELDTRHPYMWLLKSHYYGSHFYNWPCTYGPLLGLGLDARYRADVTDPAFWTASLDVCRDRIDQYERLAAEVA